ncbi:hypothetical protein IFM89_034037 [Coptis chinensis]|uniref:SKP1-like protein n=1 Tax=Coptis chinensis TaxID=261450 RepID=A0A835IV34_9MAGN|nr:hypothetical protein IFM89_034037 [Coptis chinensis]
MPGSTFKNIREKPLAADESERINNLICAFNPVLKTEKNVTLISSDKKPFIVKEDVALESQTIKHWLEDKCNDDNDEKIILPNVDSVTLKLIIKYCKKHVANREGISSSSAGDEKLRKWDKDFIELDIVTLIKLINAANFMNIKSLLDLACRRVADMMREKTPEEIRKIFNIKNDFTPEEEEEVRRANPWAFD